MQCTYIDECNISPKDEKCISHLTMLIIKTKYIFFFYITKIGIDFKQKLINLDGVPIKLQIWDTAGIDKKKIK